MKIVNKQDRGKLSEGRSYQMGFAFLKKNSEEEFEIVQPISPCKDYLNDVVYSEQSGYDCSAYGLSYKKMGIFDDNGYLTISLLPTKNGNSKYDKETLETDIKNINENYPLIENFINNFEEKLKVENFSKIQKVADNSFLLIVPKYWVKYTYLISLYTLLLRVGQFYKGGDVIEYLKTFNKFFPDIPLVKQALPKLERMLNGYVPEQKFTPEFKDYSIHNCGIVGFNFN